MLNVTKIVKVQSKLPQDLKECTAMVCSECCLYQYIDLNDKCQYRAMLHEHII